MQARYIYNNLLKNQRRVTFKRLVNFLVSNNYIDKDNAESRISGMDTTISVSLGSFHDFKDLIANALITEEQAEKIIERITYSANGSRLKKWVYNEFPNLAEADKNYISRLTYSDYGRLSKRLVNVIEGVDNKTGEIFTVIQAMWETNDNLMEIIQSPKYSFKDEIDRIKAEYYSENPTSLYDKLQEKYIPNAVKRPIYRTLDIVNDVKKAMKSSPKKIFIEMSRGGRPENKNKKTVSRRGQIEELYKNFDKNEISQLKSELDNKTDNQLRSEKLFLYFTQLGKCMYSGEDINIEYLGNKSYYDVDHIYPQSKVKDDSLSNKVLVKSELNSDKGDKYPIASNIRTNMSSFWTSLYEKNLITKKKYSRLKRNKSFTDEEMRGFINRQLVETRQSSKAIAEILKDEFPDTEIVYTKASLVSEFRQEYKLLKSRKVNDFHHAKDAYLNIVVGNVYDTKFSKKYFFHEKYFNENYTLKLRSLLNQDIKHGDEYAWRKDGSTMSQVMNTMKKNHVLLTEYSFKRKGGFFDQNPLKSGTKTSKNLIPRKKGLDPEKYGGYSKTTATYFSLVKYKSDKSEDALIMPVELLFSDKFESDADFAEEYAKKTISSIVNQTVESVSFPLGKRILKVNTQFSFDGFVACLASKSGGERHLVFSSLTSFKTSIKIEQYIKALESFSDKLKNNPDLIPYEEHTGISREKNMELYDIFIEKLSNFPFNIPFNKQLGVVIEGRKVFKSLETKDQILCLVNILSIFKTGRTTGCDLKLINGAGQAGIFTTNSKISTITKNYKEILIIDTSASGLYSKKVIDLCKL